MPGAEVLAKEPGEIVEKPVVPPATDELEKPAVPPPDPATEAEKPEEVDGTAEDEQEPDLEAAASQEQISKYKDAYKLHPELRNIVARHNAILELFPDGFKEARELREMIPTLEDAERLNNEAEQYRAMGEAFRSDPVGYIESLKESDAGAFLQLAKEMPQTLATLDVGAYREQARYYVTAVLENLQTALEGSDDKELQDALKLVTSRGLGMNLGSSAATRSNRPDPRDAELERLRRRENARQREGASEAFQEFHQQVETGYSDAVVTDIEAKIKAALPTASEPQLKRMVRETWDQLQDKLAEQPQTKAQTAKAYEAARNGRVGLAEQRNLVDFLVRRAKATVPGLIKAVVTDWSSNVLRLNGKEIKERKEVAERTRDAGSGAGAGGGTGKPVEKPKGPRTTAQIVEELRTGTYQQPGARA